MADTARFSVFTSTEPLERTVLETLLDKVTPPSLDPRAVLRDHLRLPAELQKYLEPHFRRHGLEVRDEVGGRPVDFAQPLRLEGALHLALRERPGGGRAAVARRQGERAVAREVGPVVVGDLALERDAGIEYFFVDSHGLLFADRRPVHGVYAPMLCPTGVAAFGRLAAVVAGRPAGVEEDGAVPVHQAASSMLAAKSFRKA